MLKTIYTATFQYKVLTNIIVLICLLISGFGMSKLWVSYDALVFFSDSDPVVEDYHAINDRYGIIENISLLVTPKSGNVFDHEALTAIAEITEESHSIPYSDRVSSLTNYQYIYNKNGVLIVESMLEGFAEKSLSELKEIRARYLEDNILVDTLLSEKGHVSIISTSLIMPDNNQADDSAAIIEVFDAISKMEEKYSKRYPNIEFRKLGTVTAEHVMAEVVERDMGLLVPCSMLLIAILISVFLQSFYAVGLTMTIVGCSTIIAMGVKGFFSGVVSPMTSFVPTIILTIAVADCLHLLTTFQKRMNLGESKTDALKESLRLNCKAISLTSITTLIGFLCFNFSTSPAIRDMGNVIAVGVFSAWMLSLFWLPSLIMILPTKAKTPPLLLAPLMPILSRFIANNHNRILLGSGLIIAVVLYGIPYNQINENFFDMYDDSYSLKRNSDFYNQEFTGAERFYFDINSANEGGINDPEYLKIVDEFSNWLRAQPLVRNVDAYPDLLKKMNYSMNDEKAGSFDLPQSRALAAQYLLVYELSESLSHLVSTDRKSSRVTVNISMTNSNSLLELKRQAENWLVIKAPIHMQADAVSMGILFAMTVKSNSESMVIGTLLALILISLVVSFVIRSRKLGGLSLVTNLLPVLLGYGLWGYIDGVIGLHIAMVATLAMGIVVDDTVHFITKFQDSFQKTKSTEQSILFALENAGNAILATSLIFIANFSLYMMSSYVPSIGMGILTAMTILIALTFDLLFLPALLHYFYRDVEFNSDIAKINSSVEFKK